MISISAGMNGKSKINKTKQNKIFCFVIETERRLINTKLLLILITKLLGNVLSFRTLSVS
ncbi:hypothetical protein QR98_0101190 [Sarcoptes scabiei]|uniref:Uncharacterized protein n=1 Tax=Sarcoptes scabiei TaxID=52283 RepID=A0A132AKN2_SARSC|nr:hypothetical protein QR98_0101190 [Sarcoptes scabiei]